MPPTPARSASRKPQILTAAFLKVARIGAVFVVSACGGDVTSPPTSPAVATVTVLGPAGTLQVGQAYQFTATAKDNTGSVVNGATITWSVTPSTVAGVTTSGIVTPIAAGAATVIATSESVSGNAAVSFIEAPPPLQADVLMSGEIYLPFNTTIKLNGTVRFNFPPGIVHNVIFLSRPGVPSDIEQIQNVIISRAFTTAGTFPFDCTIHPGMSGQITVVP
jgi:plastocyanin